MGISIFQHVPVKFSKYWKSLRSDGHDAVLVRGAAGNFVVKIAGTGIAFVTQMVFVRLLGAESFGHYVYTITWLNILALICTLGFDSASTRFIPLYNAKKEWGAMIGFLRFSNRIVLIASVIVSIFFAVVVWIIKKRLSPELLHTFWVACAILPVMSALQLREGRLRSLKKATVAEAPRLLLIPLIIITGILAAFFWFGLRAHASTVMIIYMVASAIAVITVSLLFQRTLPEGVLIAEISSNARQWVSVAWAMAFISGFGLLISQTSTIMIGVLVGTTEAGMYAVASGIAGFMAFISGAVNYIFAPIVADIHANKMHGDLQRITRFSAMITFYASLLMAVVLLILGHDILALVDKSFTTVYPVFAILIAGYLLSAITSPVDIALLNMTGNHVILVKIMSIGAIFNIISNTVLIQIYGLTGGAIATVASFVFGNILTKFIVWRKFRIMAMALPVKLEQK